MKNENTGLDEIDIFYNLEKFIEIVNRTFEYLGFSKVKKQIDYNQFKLENDNHIYIVYNNMQTNVDRDIHIYFHNDFTIPNKLKELYYNDIIKLSLQCFNFIFTTSNFVHLKLYDDVYAYINYYINSEKLRSIDGFKNFGFVKGYFTNNIHNYNLDDINLEVMFMSNEFFKSSKSGIAAVVYDKLNEEFSEKYYVDNINITKQVIKWIQQNNLDDKKDNNYNFINEDTLTLFNLKF